MRSLPSSQKKGEKRAINMLKSETYEDKYKRRVTEPRAERKAVSPSVNESSSHEDT